MRTSVSGNTRNPSSAVLLRCKQKLLLSGGVFWGGGRSIGFSFCCYLFGLGFVFIFNALIVYLHFVALAMGLCVAMIAFVRLPSLKVSCLLLSGLLIYDVFWVSALFCSA